MLEHIEKVSPVSEQARMLLRRADVLKDKALDNRRNGQSLDSVLGDLKKARRKLVKAKIVANLDGDKYLYGVAKSRIEETRSIVGQLVEAEVYFAIELEDLEKILRPDKRG